MAGICMSSKTRLIIRKIACYLSGMSFIILLTPDKSNNLYIYLFAPILVFGILFTSKMNRALLEDCHKMNYLIVALLLNASLGFNFYANWTKYEEGATVVLANMLGMDRSLLVSLAAAIVVVLSCPIVALCLSILCPKTVSYFLDGKELTETEKKEKNIGIAKAIVLLTGIYTLAISALLKADFNYIDDMGRAFYGYKHWGDYSRILSNSLSTYVHMGHYLTDVAPWSQLVAIFIVAIAGVILLRAVYGRNTFSIWEILALVPLAINPYFLECLSYKFDSPYMALSLLGAMIPFVFLEGGVFSAIYGTMIGTVIVCCSYQAATGFFPLVIVSIVIRRWAKKENLKELAKYIGKAVTGYCLGLLFYNEVIMRPTDGSTVFSSDFAALGEVFTAVCDNLKAYYSLFLSDFKKIWLLLIAYMVVAFIVVFCRYSERKKWESAVVCVLAFLFWGFYAFGLYIFIPKTFFAPRTMYGIGCIITMMAVVIMEDHAKKMQFSVPVLMLISMFFVFSFTYGNALKYQKEYNLFRMDRVIDDLNDCGLLSEDQPITVHIMGEIEKAPIIRNMPQDYKIMNRLLPLDFGGPNCWSSYYFSHFYGISNMEVDDNEYEGDLDLPIVSDNVFQTIRSEGGTVLVQLK